MSFGIVYLKDAIELQPVTQAFGGVKVKTIAVPNNFEGVLRFPLGFTIDISRWPHAVQEGDEGAMVNALANHEGQPDFIDLR
jgi:hypothetical protein